MSIKGYIWPSISPSIHQSVIKINENQCNQVISRALHFDNILGIFFSSSTLSKNAIFHIVSVSVKNESCRVVSSRVTSLGASWGLLPYHIISSFVGVVVVGDDHSVEGKNNSQHRA